MCGANPCPPAPDATGDRMYLREAWSAGRSCGGGVRHQVDPATRARRATQPSGPKTGPRRRSANPRKAGDGITTEIAERPAPAHTHGAPRPAEDPPTPHPGAFTGGGQSGHITGIATSTGRRRIALITSSFRRITDSSSSTIQRREAQGPGGRRLSDLVEAGIEDFWVGVEAATSRVALLICPNSRPLSRLTNEWPGRLWQGHSYPCL